MSGDPEVLGPVDETSSLTTSVRYAGASGDLNPLHFDEGFAADVSPTGGVITHGMYAMGLASRLLTAWAGGPEHVVEVAVRFTKPWPLGTTTTFKGVVKGTDDDGVTTVTLTAHNDGNLIMRGSGKVRRSGG